MSRDHQVGDKRTLADPGKVRRPARLLPALFFFSGASALIFQVLWQRMMTLELGASAPATSAILTSFFCGIALGSYVGGRWLARFENALQFYWRAELAIGLFGLAVPLILAGVRLVNVRYMAGLEATPVAALGLRFLLAVLTTLPATLGMGATIPAMNRLLAESQGTVGGSVAFAFGLNTLGAVLGCLAAGVLFLPWWGVSRTLAVAAGINLLIAVTAFALARRNRLAPSAADGTTQAVGPGDVVTDAGQVEEVAFPQLLVGGYVLAGALALGYEVVWMRLLSIYSSSSSLTFTLALSVYLLGFGLGSLALHPLLARWMSGRALFALSNIGVGTSVLILLPVVYAFPQLNAWLILEPATREVLSWTRVATVEWGMSLLMIFVPTVFMGLAYPAVCQALVQSVARIGRDSGRLYFLGTVGSMLGVLFFGMLAIPKFGFVVAIVQLCGTSLLIGAAVALAEHGLPGRQRSGLLAVAGLAALGLWVFFSTNLPFVSFQYDAGPRDVVDGDVRTRLVRYREGASGTVIVSEEYPPDGPPQRTIMVDGKPVSGTHFAAQIDAKMLAHIPLLLHPDPQRALTVGFGSGGTSWSLTRHNIQAECVEIEPEVVRSAGLFASQNFDVLSQPGYKLILNDARNHLLTTPTRYDAIATDVTTLQYKHNSSLYTYEYFDLMKARLTPGGIACAWIPMSATSEDEFRILLRTFGTAFPHATMWYVNHRFTNFAILIGTPRPLQVDIRRVRQALSAGDVAIDLRSIGVTDPWQFLHFLYLDETGYDAFVGDGLLHTDDYPVLEFSSPTSAFTMERLFVRNLQGSLPHRIQDYSTVVTGLNADEHVELAKYSAAAMLTMQAVTDHLAADFADTPQQAADLHARAADNIRQALGGYRNDDARMFVLNRIELAQQTHAVKHNLPKVTLRTDITDNFDGPMELTLYRQIGKSRPTNNPQRHANWAEAMQRFAQRSGFVSKLGRDGSVALQILPLPGATTLGYFCPLPVEPQRSYEVTFWSDVALTSPASAGLVVLEFDAASLSGEQAPDFIVQDHVVAVHGPQARTERGTWQPSTLQFRTSADCRMIHLVFFLDRARGEDRALIDDVQFRRVD